MRVIRAHEHRVMPWKNGAGETAEVAVGPPSAQLGDFDWRISIASVTSDGPFSIFPGIDRTIALLAGNGLWLAVEGQWPVELLPQSGTFSFAGDVAVKATLLRGSVRDFNVMTRRARLRHEVGRVHVSRQTDLQAGGSPATLVFCESGAVAVDGAGKQVRLEAHDSLMVDQGAAQLRLLPEMPTTLLVVEIIAREQCEDLRADS